MKVTNFQKNFLITKQFFQTMTGQNNFETEKPYLVDYIIQSCEKEGVNCYHWNVINDKINYAQSKN